MALTLTIGLPAEEVAISHRRSAVWRRTSAQWTEFYGRLMFSKRNDAAWLTAGELSELRSWKGMQPKNVGKAVARHLQATRSMGACVLESDNPTLRWRLAPRAQYQIVEDSMTLEDWLQERGMGACASEIDFTWLQSMTRAQIEFGLGRLVLCEAYAWEAARVPAIPVDCRRVAALMILRAAAGRNRAIVTRDHVERMVLPDELRKGSTNAWGSGALGDYIRSRLLALEAIDSGAEEATAHLTRIRRKLESSERAGNIAAQIILSNTLGLLASRSGRYREARHYLIECQILCLAVGDLFTLGGAMFNFGVALLNDGIGSGAVRPLIELCVEMDHKLFVGRSSAQAEILLVRLLLDEGDLTRAETAMKAAEEMVTSSGSPYDRGCLDVAHAKLLWARAAASTITPAAVARISELLERASDAFRASGRKSDYVDEQIAALARGQGLSLSCLA